ncbi:general vesicular transport factor p115 isoform X2 [Lycorma delicatula]|uniref:general vesicular transport factor p115 isoform X2 n=1 Tax=Lycorma delicatula TaxID=130591 RepID=UPI003F5179CC
MEYFKSGLKSVLGAQQPGAQPSGAETVERLVERVQSSTLLDDRRDACRALKALSRKYRIEVGAQGMDTLKQVLEMDQLDCEIVGYALDTLCNITAPEAFEEEERPELSHESLLHVGEQFTEIFIKHTDNVGLILGFLEEYDFRVRWPAVKLLTNLLANKPKDIQEIILVSPMGVSKLMDLLADSREVIRNDALLLLIQLSKGNANIQKIVAFENAFDRLFGVISEEGYADGGVVVEDCLLLMLNLLRNNTSNQNFFKEGSYIQRLSPMFELPAEGGDDGLWARNKASTIHFALQVVRTLVSPSNPAQVTASCQKALRASGILESMCGILMASGVPVDILTETICAVAESIRGNPSNQEYFSSVLAPSTPPREAIVVLLMSMVNEKQPFSLRCAILYCFQCFLFKNEVGQSQLVQTLLPSSTEVVALTSGQLLCGGLFSHDPLSNWFSAVGLSHSLIENPAQREQLLRVLLAASTPGSSPISLLHQAMLLLQQHGKVQSKLGLLILLSTWLSHCPLAVKQFLSIPASIPYLTGQAVSTERDDNEELVQGLCAFLMGICVYFNDGSVPNFTQEDLRHLIAKRVGLENFLDKLGEVSRHEMYSTAFKQPQLRPRTPSDLLLDHEFCRLFKALEGMIIKAVTANVSGGLLNGSVELSQTDNTLLMQYKDLIRDQDRRFYELEQANEALKQENKLANKQIEELNNTVAQLRDQNMVLKAHVNSGHAIFTTPSQENSNILAEVERMQNECRKKDIIIKKLEEVKKLQTETVTSQLQNTSINEADKSNEAQSDLEQLRSKLIETEAKLEQALSTGAQLEQLKKDQDDLLELLAYQEFKIASLKERLKLLGEKVDEDEEVEDSVNIPSETIPTKS